MAWKKSKFIAATTLSSYEDVFKLIRNQFTTWHARKKAENASRVSWGKYKCAKCLNLVRRDEKQMDHIIPISSTPRIPVNASDINDSHYLSVGKWFFRVFCSQENIQALCMPCHKQKTLQELEERMQRNNK